MANHLNIIIYGKVQGVGFRWATASKANKLGVVGFVKNLPNGSLYIEAEGEGKNFDDFLAWCNKGPLWSKVDHIETSEGELKHFEKFVIL